MFQVFKEDIMADTLYVVRVVTFNIESGADTACELEGDTPDAINEFVIVKNPEHIEVRDFDAGAGTFTLCAPTGFVGLDSMKVMIKDDAGASDPVEIPITVFASVAPPPVKLPPSARPTAEPSPAPVAPVATPVAPTPARATINCPRCAGLNTLGSVYCSSCGAAIVAPTAKAAPVAPITPVPAAAPAIPDLVAKTAPVVAATSAVKPVTPAPETKAPDPATTPATVETPVTPAPETKAPINCPKCNLHQPDGAVYCSSCGAAMKTPAPRRTAPSAASTKALAKPKKEEGETPEKKEEDKKPKASDPVADKKDATAAKDKASWQRKAKELLKKPPQVMIWIIAILLLVLAVVAVKCGPDIATHWAPPASSSGSAAASTSTSVPVSVPTPSSTTTATATKDLCPSGYISIPATAENVCRYLGYPASEVPDEISTSPGPGRLLVCREAPTGSGVADITGHECMICWPKQVKLGVKTSATEAAPLLWNQQANHMKPPSWASQPGQPPRYPNCGEVQMLDCEVALNPDGSENNSACNVLPPALTK
ncbi:MAG: hypothetical protein WC750_00600 [Patescibacteria group bacterium]